MMELLCPAGSFDSFKAAVNNGADAVYFGGRDFNARAGALNFTNDELIEAIDYAHLRGVKVNITINTLYKSHSPDDSEAYRAMTFAQRMYEAGADALIITDLGLFSLIKPNMPDIRLHASTQMTVHSLEGAKFLGELGFDRIVLSRELSLSEIKLITEGAGVEIEVFAHGALCVSYSGQCLMSSLLGGRSGNRGKCAQPCRQFYTLLGNDKKRANGYLLSPRDIMTFKHLKEIGDSGVHTLKIEGRMKSPEYVAVVTRAYREQLDRAAEGIYDVPQKVIKDVTQIFNRGGESTSGYFFDYSGTNMMSVETPKSTGTYLGKVASVSKHTAPNGKKKILIKIESKVTPGDGVEIWTEERENTGGYINEEAKAGAVVTVYAPGDIKAGDRVYKSYDKELSDRTKAYVAADIRKIPLILTVRVKLGQPMEMTLTGKGMGIVSATVYRDIIELSKSQPMTSERILEQLTKLGGTPFEIGQINADIDMEDNIYIPISALNELRRACAREFELEYTNSFKRKFEGDNEPFKPVREANYGYYLSIQAVSEEQLSAACEEGVSSAYFTIKGYDNKKPLEIGKKYGDKTALYIALPKIMRPFEESNLEALIKSLEKTDIKGYLVSTYGQLAILLKYTKKEIVTDYSFNVFNPMAYNYLKSLGGNAITISPELNMNELRAFPGGEVIVYGNLPLMISVQCPIGLYVAKDKKGKHCSLCNKEDSTYHLMDKTGAAFPIYTDCAGCYALILNGPKLNMQEKLHNFKDTNLDSLRLIFYTEDYDEVKSVLKGFETGTKPTGDITYGHFFRGAK
ncbi:MAG: DUF3656 domain-containing protein [Defluviitaleaceae bacterium]|nr:DUF3656 domain-containing protein [Defluviitaleaceae bacterium]